MSHVPHGDQRQSGTIGLHVGLHGGILIWEMMGRNFVCKVWKGVKYTVGTKERTKDVETGM